MSTITLGERLPFDVTWRVASIPSMTGMRTSIRTTCGRSVRQSSTACAPRGGSAHDPKVGLLPSCREPGAHDLLVVHDDDAIGRRDA